MIKLKQILLEGLGDCYPAGGRLIMNFFGDKEHKLVHGMVNGQGALEGMRYGHCWVESRDTVLDHSNGRKLEIPKQVYYALGRVNPKECKYYTAEEAAKFMVDEGHWGPWEMSGDTVMAEEIPDRKSEVGKQDVKINPNELDNIESKLTQEIPEFFYHATYKALLPSIKATGLDTREAALAWEDSKPGIVYLANSPSVAESYAEAAENVSDDIYDSGIVILKVASKDLDLSKLKDDSNVQEDNSDTYEYYGQIPWNKLSVTNLYDKDNLNENTTYANYIDYKQQIKDLTKHMLSLDLNITPLPKVIFKHNDVSNAKDFFGKTAYYVPSTQTIVLYTEGRHPKDVARSFSHEMIHHIQNLEGRLGNINTTNTNEDEELDMIESEAYLRGNMIFRNWTDSIDGEITTDIEEGGSLIPIKIKKSKPDPFGINAYARELATGLEEAFLNEGKYDSLITKLAGYTLNAW